MIDIGRIIILLAELAGRAGPAARPTRPLRQSDRIVPIGQLVRQRAGGVQHKRRAIEHQFILPANAVQIDERQAGFHHTGDGEVQPAIILAHFERAAIGHDQQFRAGFGQAFAYVRRPHVLAHRHADAHPTQVHWARQGPGAEQAFFVERAVIGQIMLAGDASDAAAIQQQHGVVEHAVLRPRRADQQRRAAVRRGLRQPLHLHLRRFDQRRFQHQIFRRIADDGQFGGDQQIGRRHQSARGQYGIGIAGQIAHAGVQLGKGDGQPVGHGPRDTRLWCIRPAGCDP